MFKKKYLFLTLFLIFLFTLFLSNSAYATFEFEKDGTTYSYPDLPNDKGVFLISNGNSEYSGTYLLISNSNVSDLQSWHNDPTVEGREYKLLFSEAPYSSGIKIQLCYGYVENGTFTNIGVGANKFLTLYSLSGNSWVPDQSSTYYMNIYYNPLSKLVYSSVDVCVNNDITNVFFQGPLPLEEIQELPQVQLMTPMQVEEIPLLITKVLIILVPIGLTIFGALCLAYLLKSRIWRPW